MKTRYALAILAIGAFAVAEAGARFALRLGDPPLSIAHPSIEYMFRPNQDARPFGNHFVVNEYGMRSESFPKTETAAELRIMVFGDSVLNGGNLTDHDDLATTLLERRLQQKGGPKVVVGNVSAGSWGPGNWLAYAREFGFFDADWVVLVISSHDPGDNPTFAPLDPRTHPQAKPAVALIEGVTRYLPRYLPASSGGSASAALPNEEEKRAAMRRGLSDLGEFLDLARAQTPHVLVLQHAERREIESGHFDAGHAAIQRLAAERNVPAVQLAPAFAAAMEHGENPYRDNIHPNETGQRLIATVLEQQLSSR